MIIPTSNLQAPQAAQSGGRAHGATPVNGVVLPAPTQPAQPAQTPPSPEQVRSAVAAINQALKHTNHSIEFSVDTDTHRTVVKMVDTSTGELIRQFPSDAALAISQGIEQYQQGLLLRKKA